MALERKWLTIPLISLTSDGTSLGVVTVANTVDFKDKQLVYLQSDIVAPTLYQIKRVISNTQFIVGPVNNKVSPTDFSDISAYKVADNAKTGASEQDKLAQPTDKDHYFAIYESSPVNADRVISVDPHGEFYDQENPMPVSFTGSISIGSVEVKGTNGNFIEPNTDGSLNVNIISAPVTGQVEKSIYNEVASVASGVETLISSYTVPIAKTAVLHRINTSGENVGRYRVYLNNVPFDTQRTYFGGDFNALFEFITGNSSGYVLNAGDVIAVKILHTRPFVGNFNARIQLLEIT